MANDMYTLSESRQIVPPAWSKLVSKAGDIVRNQKVKVTAPLPASPIIHQPINRLEHLGNLQEQPVSFKSNNLDLIISSHQKALNVDSVLVDSTYDLEVQEQLMDPVQQPPHVMLSYRIEEALREAKESSLHCEVLVPCDMIARIAKDIVSMSDHEPCGIRGCLVYISLEEKNVCRKIGRLRVDPGTVATFELHLTLQRDAGNWLSLKQLIPSRFLKKVGKSPALIISEAYTLKKKKLYRSSSRD